MSCETNNNKASRGASLAGGIHQIQSKAAAVSVAMANRLLNVIDREGVGAKVARNPVIGTIDSALRYTPGAVRSAAIGVLLGSAAATSGPAGLVALGGTLAALYGAAAYGQRLRADKSNGPVEEIDDPAGSRPGEVNDPEESKIPIWPKKGDSASLVFQIPQSATNWEKRSRGQAGYTMTILKTTRRSGPEYYFQGDLSNAAAVGLAAGAVKPYRLPGYLGTVSEKEKLSPLWALSKRRLIWLSCQGVPAPGAAGEAADELRP
jgi:hypothetical protein